MRTGYISAALAAASLFMLGTAPDEFARRLMKHRRATPQPGKRYRGCGERECARRRRQIDSGQLTHANGLVSAA